MVWHPDFERAFHPRSIAIVGVSDKPGPILNQGGYGFVRDLQKLAYPGKIYPVHPTVTVVRGLRVYQSLRELPEAPDHVILAVPATAVPTVLEDCAALGARNVHVYTSGFGETGEPEGRDLEARVKWIAERHALQLVGPNCMGLHVPAGRITTFTDVPSKAGPVGMVSQSGGHAIQFAEDAAAQDVYVSKVDSFGNGLVMDAVDFLGYLATDPETRLICSYLEGAPRGRELLRLVRETTPRKPVILWKGGLSEEGGRAAASHTGSLAGTRAIWQAFFAQTGAVSVGSVEEMVDTAAAFLYMRPPQGHRVGLLGAGGGTSVYLADLFVQEGLSLPRLAASTRAALRSFISAAGNSIQNPLDIGPVLGSSEGTIRSLELVADDPSIDVILATFNLFSMAGRQESPAEVADFLVKMAQTRERPRLGIVIAAGRDPRTRELRRDYTLRFQEAGIGIFRSLPRASKALGRLVAYQAFLREIGAAPVGPLGG